jgi:hypothetical protein
MRNGRWDHAIDASVPVDEVYARIRSCVFGGDDMQAKNSVIVACPVQQHSCSLLPRLQGGDAVGLRDHSVLPQVLLIWRTVRSLTGPRLKKAIEKKGKLKSNQKPEYSAACLLFYTMR